jgi:hypothetical protein
VIPAYKLHNWLCCGNLLNYNWDFAYDNGFAILAECLDMVIIMVFAINDNMFFWGRRE